MGKTEDNSQSIRDPQVKISSCFRTREQSVNGEANSYVPVAMRGFQNWLVGYNGLISGLLPAREGHRGKKM